MVTIAIDVSVTHKAEETFQKYKDVFGEVISAEMYNTLGKLDYKLVLTNNKGDEMHILNGLTSGYVGAGPNGTYRVLRSAGFDIDEGYVHRNSCFKLTK